MASVDAHLAIMDEAEATFQSQLATSLAAAAEELLLGLRSGGRFQELSSRLSGTVRAQVSALWEQTIRAMGGLREEDLGIKADLPAQYLEDYREQYGNRQLTRIINTTQEQLLATILIGQRRGESIDSIVQALLAEVPRLGDVRARRIARTETHAALQYASQRIAMASGYQLRKIWNTVGDERVRDFGTMGRVSKFNHRAMQGVEVPLDHKFPVPMLGGGAELLLFPGDPDGSAGNIIECRCIQTYKRRA